MPTYKSFSRKPRSRVLRPVSSAPDEKANVSFPPRSAQTPNPPVAIECWRVPRVAKLLDVSKKRVYQLIRERRLDVIRLGPRQMRVLKRSVEQYVGRLLEEEKARDY